MKNFKVGETVWAYESYLSDNVYPAEVVAVDKKNKIVIFKTSEFNYDQSGYKHLFKTKNAAINYGIRHEKKCIGEHLDAINSMRKQEEG